MDERVYIWDCYVLSIGRKYFWARMVERSGAIFDHDGQIPIARVTKKDRNVFQVGAIFTLRSGRGRSSLKFSHARYTEEDIVAAKRRAKRILKCFAHSASGDKHG